jgi:hypothetical protein
MRGVCHALALEHRTPSVGACAPRPSHAEGKGGGGTSVGNAGSGGSGSGGKAGAGGKGGFGGTASGVSGASGVAGTGVGGAEGVDFGKPQWSSVGTIGPCTVERLGNPGDLRAYAWKPCLDGDAGCEEAVLSPSLLSQAGVVEISAASAVVEADGNVLVAVRDLSGGLYAGAMVVADADGAVIDGFRSVGKDCVIGGVSTWAPRYGAGLFTFSEDGTVWSGAVLGAVGQSPSLVALPDIAEGPQGYPMSPSRWGWRLVGGSLVSFDSGTGAGTTKFASSSIAGPILDESYPAATSDGFLFLETVLRTDNTVEKRIAASDGIATPHPYIVGQDGSDVGTPMFCEHARCLATWNSAD